jgi:hypothetical protein
MLRTDTHRYRNPEVDVLRLNLRAHGSGRRLS